MENIYKDLTTNEIAEINGGVFLEALATAVGLVVALGEVAEEFGRSCARAIKE